MIGTKKCSRKNLGSTEGISINIQTLSFHIHLDMEQQSGSLITPFYIDSSM